MTDQADEPLDLFDAPARWRAQIIGDFRLRDAERCAAASPVPGFPQLLDSLMFALAGLPDGLWLDLGGGLGGAASWIERTSDHHVVVVDPSPETVSAAGQLFPTLALAVGAGQVLPIASSSIPAVIISGVISLIDDLDALLLEVNRVLAPGGRIAVTDIWSATATSFDSPPNRFRSLEDFTRTCDLHGFRQVHVGVAELTTGWWPSAATQVNDEIVARHADEEGFERWRADLDHLDTVLASGSVIPAGIVLERATRP